jgi:hypothetical protein
MAPGSNLDRGVRVMQNRNWLPALSDGIKGFPSMLTPTPGIGAGARVEDV